MALGDADKEYLWQLSLIYPSDFVTELKVLVEDTINKQLAAGERQNIREIVRSTMEKMLAENSGVSPEAEAESDKTAQEAAQEVQEKVLAALRCGQPDLLAGMGPEVIAPLVEALNGDEQLAVTARKAFCQLTDGGAIDALCGLWAESRSPELEQIITESGYLASQPLKVRLLTVLKTGADRIMLAEGVKLIPELLTVVDDADRSIAGRARRLLLTLTNRQAIDAVCQTVLAGNHERLKQWAVIANYAPASDSKAALYYCVTGQWDKYYALDWQESRPLLTKGYIKATPLERQQFLQSARQSGHSLLLAGLLLTGGYQDEYEEITNDDWATMLDILVSQERWSELYRLIFKAPVNWAAEIVLALMSAGWRPEPWASAVWERILHSCPQAGRELFVPDGREVAVLENHDGHAHIDSMAFHPNGRIVAGGGGDGRLRLWHVASGNLWRTVDLHADSITAVTFTPDGRYLITASREGKVLIWRFPDVKWVKSVSGQPGLVTALAGDNGGYVLAIACPGGALPARVWAWDGAYMTNQGQYLGSLFSAAAINIERKMAAGGGRDGKIRIYTLTGGKGSNASWLAHTGTVQRLFFTGDGRLAISNGADSEVKIWQTDSGRLLWHNDGSGKLLAAGCDAALAAVARPEGGIAIRQLRFTKPLALATHADWYQAKVLVAQPVCQPAVSFLAAVLGAKFQYDIML